MASDFRLGISEDELTELVELLWRVSWAVKTSTDFPEKFVGHAAYFHDRFAIVLRKKEADRIATRWFSSLEEERAYNRNQRELALEEEKMQAALAKYNEDFQRELRKQSSEP